MGAERAATPVERSIARVRARDGDRPAGQAFAVDERHVVTCAHVVNAALGRRAAATDVPAERLLLEFVLGGDGAPDVLPVRYGKVVGWSPLVEDDMAVLELAEPLPAGVTVPRLGTGRPSSTVRAFGPGQGHEDDDDHEGHVRATLMGEVAGFRLQIDGVPANVVRVGPGFSGGPVWDDATRRVVGLVQARGVGGASDGLYVVPSRRIASLTGGRVDDEDDEDDDPGSARAVHLRLAAMSLASGVGGFLLYQGVGFGPYHALRFLQVLPTVDPVGTVGAAVVGSLVAAAVQLTGSLGILVVDRRGGTHASRS